MREILFKAKRESNRKWVEGYYYKENFLTGKSVQHFIRGKDDTDYVVCGETVSQYVSYMYRNALGKFVITKSNSKRIEDTVRRCEDIMIYMDVDAEMKMFLCHVEKRDDVYRLLAKEHFFGGETNANAPAYSAEFSLREANLCIADVTSWAKAVANA